MKIIIALTLGFWPIFSSGLLGQNSLQKKYPHSLLTNDFEVLSDEDLLYDMKTEKVTPYDIESMSRYPRWQCFPAKDVSFKYDRWKGNDPVGLSHVIVTMCYLAIEAREGELTHIYTDRRARNIEFCQSYQKSWKQLIHKQTHVCLNGESEYLKKREKIWTWVKAKTKNGCISLFEGNCNTKK